MSSGKSKETERESGADVLLEETGVTKLPGIPLKAMVQQCRISFGERKSYQRVN